MLVIIWLEARLQRNIGNTLQHILALFMRSGIKLFRRVNRFGWNLEHFE